MSQYFVRRAGRVDGPWTFDRLQSEVRLKKLSKFHEVSSDGNSWLRADQVPDLFEMRLLSRRFNPPEPASEPVVSGEVAQVQANVPSPTDQPRVWYIEMQGEPAGPYSSTEIRDAWVGGRLESELAWREGLANWLSLREIPEFSYWYNQRQPEQVAMNMGPVEVHRAAQDSPAPAVPWLGIAWLGIVFLVILLGFIIASRGNVEADIQAKREFFVFFKAEQAVRDEKIGQAISRKVTSEVIRELKSLQRSLGSYDTSKLTPDVRRSIAAYIEKIESLNVKLRAFEQLNSPEQVVVTLFDAMRRISEGDRFGPIADRLSSEMAVQRAVAEGFEEYFDSQADLLSLAPT